MNLHTKTQSLIEMLDDLIYSLLTDGAPLTEERIYELCDECIKNKKPQPLIRALGEAFTQPVILAKSFPNKVSESEEKSKGLDAFFKFLDLIFTYFLFYIYLSYIFNVILVIT